jgi:hypothetical protein
VIRCRGRGTLKSEVETDMASLKLENLVVPQKVSK